MIAPFDPDTEPICNTQPRCTPVFTVTFQIEDRPPTTRRRTGTNVFAAVAPLYHNSYFLGLRFRLISITFAWEEFDA